MAGPCTLQLTCVLFLKLLLEAAKCAACGTNYTDQLNGEIKSPNYPNNYPNDMECYWSIQAPEGSLILVELLEFKLAYYRCYDHVRIFDSDKPLHKTEYLCGEQWPSSVVTTTNFVQVYFFSSYISNDKGFKLSWKVVGKPDINTDVLEWKDAVVGCSKTPGASLYSDSLTPTYSNTLIKHMVANNINEVWSGRYFVPWAWLKGCYRLSNPPGFTTFKSNRLDVCLNRCHGSTYFGMQGQKCFCFDDFTGDFLDMGKICTYNCPGNKDETCGGGGNALTIYMNDICYTNSVEWNGTISMAYSQPCLNWSSVLSPGIGYFPDGSAEAAANYCRDPLDSGNLWCYVSKTQEKTESRPCEIPKCMESRDGDINPDGLHSCMALQSLDEERIETRQMACSTELASVCQSQDMLNLITRGYSWHDARDLCKSQSQYYTLAGLPYYQRQPRPFQGYLNILTWFGYSRSEAIVTELVPTQPPLDCYKLVIDGDSLTSVATKCSTKLPYICVNEPTFCGGQLNLTEGPLRYPEKYPDMNLKSPDNTACLWTLDVEQGQQLTIEIDFDIEYSYQCTNDFLNLFEGTNERSTLVDTYCGKSHTPLLTSRGPVVTLQYVTDDSDSSKGFSANWTIGPIPTTTTTSTTMPTTTTTQPTTHKSSTTSGKQVTQKKNDLGGESDTSSGGTLIGIIIGLLLVLMICVIVTVIFVKRRRDRNSKKSQASDSEKPQSTAIVNKGYDEPWSTEKVNNSISISLRQIEHNSSSQGPGDLGLNTIKITPESDGVSDYLYSRVSKDTIEGPPGDGYTVTDAPGYVYSSVEKSGNRKVENDKKQTVNMSSDLGDTDEYNTLHQTFEPGYINRVDNVYNHTGGQPSRDYDHIEKGNHRPVFKPEASIEASLYNHLEQTDEMGNHSDTDDHYSHTNKLGQYTNTKLRGNATISATEDSADVYNHIGQTDELYDHTDTLQRKAYTGNHGDNVYDHSIQQEATGQSNIVDDTYYNL